MAREARAPGDPGSKFVLLCNHSGGPSRFRPASVSPLVQWAGKGSHHGTSGRPLGPSSAFFFHFCCRHPFRRSEGRVQGSKNLKVTSQRDRDQREEGEMERWTWQSQVGRPALGLQSVLSLPQGISLTHLPLPWTPSLLCPPWCLIFIPPAAFRVVFPYKL